MSDQKLKTYAGYIAIVGRPNVGKSTLLNKILGQKVSITARKAQTTRYKILGIKTKDAYQAIYVDTPGIHSKFDNSLNQYMNKAALSVLHDVDLIVFVVATSWKEDDEVVLKALSQVKCPIILAVNKVDLVSQKPRLLSYIEKLNERFDFKAIIPLSAQDGTNLKALEELVNEELPQSPFLFPDEQSTDRDDKFFAAEMIREKLTRLLGEEIPYSISVMIDQMVEKKGILSIMATIYVERRGQKVIVVGKNGEVLKKIGTLARQDMEDKFSKKIFLQLWVKVKTKWTRDAKLLRYLGYEE